MLPRIGTENKYGQDFAKHQLRTGDRRRDQHFQIAAFAFTHNRDAGEQHHRHRKNDSDQPGHDVYFRSPFGIIETHHVDLRRARRNTFVRRRRDRHPGQLCRRVLHRRVAAVHQHLQRFASVEPASFKVRRNHNANADIAAAQAFHQLLGLCCSVAWPDHARCDHVHDHRARCGRVRLIGHATLQHSPSS
jgi:hypothetical protein